MLQCLLCPALFWEHLLSRAVEPQVFVVLFAVGSCYKGDLVCEKDKLGYEAISTLHHQMDDDENGDIDLEESAEVGFSNARLG